MGKVTHGGSPGIRYPCQKRCACSRVKVAVRMWLPLCVVRFPPVGRTRVLGMPPCVFLPTFLIVPKLFPFSLGLFKFPSASEASFNTPKPFCSLRIEDKSFPRGWGALSYWEKYIHFLLKYMYVNICIF